MVSHDLVIPVYCPNCENLTFIHKQESNGTVRLLDHNEAQWSEHPCISLRGEEIQQDELYQTSAALEWGVQELPFKLNRAIPIKKDRAYTLGTILTVLQADEEKGSFQVLTIEGKIIEVRAKLDGTPISAGMLIDITSLVRVGRDKFRLREFRQAIVPEELDQSVRVPTEFYQITLQSQDTVLLETFVNRFLQFFIEQRSPAFSVLPLPVIQQESGNIHQRQIRLCPEGNLMEQFKSIQLPESIQVSVQQITAKK